MKCQHCGIHFDDEERVCPMCGARAGSKGRMTRPAPKWHGKPRETYTEYHPTIENSSSAKTAKSKARPIKDKPKKNSAKGVVIAIIVIALLQIVPAIFAFVMDDLVPEIELSSNDLLLDLATIGLGIAFVPDYCLPNHSSDLFPLTLAEELPSRQLMLVHSEQLPLSPAAKQFLEYFTA